MAQFMKIETTDAVNKEVFIGIGEVTHIKLGDPSNQDTDTKITIVYGDSSSCTINFTGESANADTPLNVLKAFNAALVANPGGQVSTVGKPLVTAQVIKDAAGNVAIDGTMYITTPAVYVTYTGVAFA